MFEDLKEKITREIERSVARAASSVMKSAIAPVKRLVLVFVVRAVILALGIVFTVLGAVLLGSKYIGLDLMALAAGLLLIVLFLLVK